MAIRNVLRVCISHVLCNSCRIFPLLISPGEIRTPFFAAFGSDASLCRFQVTVADALKHPNWDMGAKITVDSATMMNKGLEVIEAHYLFGADYEDIDIVVHPESIIHSMVGLVLSCVRPPPVRLPYIYGVTEQRRTSLGATSPK